MLYSTDASLVPGTGARRRCTRQRESCVGELTFWGFGHVMSCASSRAPCEGTTVGSKPVSALLLALYNGLVRVPVYGSCVPITHPPHRCTTVRREAGCLGGRGAPTGDGGPPHLRLYRISCSCCALESSGSRRLCHASAWGGAQRDEVSMGAHAARPVLPCLCCVVLRCAVVGPHAHISGLTSQKSRGWLS